jgi:hypothetical protein
MTYADVQSALSCAGIPLRQLQGPGHVLVTPAAGRIVAMAFTPDGPNLFWSHPQLADSELVKNHPETLVGNLGGDRLWFGPELDYFWNGVPDWANLSNYRVPSDADPGRYQFLDTESDAISLRAQVRLTVRASGERVGFTVKRTFRMAPAPIEAGAHILKEVKYVGIQTLHEIEFEPTTLKGRIDLWHLLQLPVGSLLMVPTKPCTTNCERDPLLYCGPGGWTEHPDCILWRYVGTACTKFGLSSRTLTGRSGVIASLPSGQLSLIVREFSVDHTATYADHPYGVPRSDQCFQVWDGLGFGEMEYHSPMLDAQCGPRALNESDHLWAFAGAPRLIRLLAERLLGIQAPFVKADLE